MGEVVGFRRKRLAGFLPGDLGRDDADRRRERERQIDAIKPEPEKPSTVFYDSTDWTDVGPYCC